MKKKFWGRIGQEEKRHLEVSGGRSAVLNTGKKEGVGREVSPSVIDSGRQKGTGRVATEVHCFPGKITEADSPGQRGDGEA